VSTIFHQLSTDSHHRGLFQPLYFPAFEKEFILAELLSILG
jgi:hypothetical protein